MPGDHSMPLKSLKWYKQLATSKGRLESGVFAVEGERAIRQIIDSHPDHVIEIVAVEELPARYRKYPVRLVTSSQFRSISKAKTPQDIMAVVRIPADMYSDSLPENAGNRLLFLEDVQDPGNVGTLIRAAAAFDFAGVILSDKCADPLSPKCVQSTAGSVLSVWMRRTVRYLVLVKELKSKGYCLVAAALDGKEDTFVLSRREKLLLALGNEASGLSEAVLKESDYRLRIPVSVAKAESLNVAACGAICMYLASCE